MHATDSASSPALRSEHNRLPAADRGAPGRHPHPRQRRHPNCRR